MLDFNGAAERSRLSGAAAHTDSIDANDLAGRAGETPDRPRGAVGPSLLRIRMVGVDHDVPTAGAGAVSPSVPGAWPEACKLGVERGADLLSEVVRPMASASSARMGAGLRGSNR